jgi:hypothetical protein
MKASELIEAVKAAMELSESDPEVMFDGSEFEHDVYDVEIQEHKNKTVIMMS